MIVIVLTVSPPRLRGHLTRWLFEISPGVYVGKVSARVRELLWEQILENLGKGRAIMVYPSDNEQGLEFRTRGQEWEPVDYDGLKLIMRPNTSRKQQNNGSRKTPKTGWSNASRRRRFGR
ncbi:type I-E CRISPR-associated endoribonuclease Cas2e [Bifidobacterium simiarum]|uniref:type I-E CRISPR-associated endoribonuclease Cas2e n=1 Tax=Bifidobacterium simiarum TaxID=2045441 RepID=UPI001BDC6A3B|nr:type I-E CRISPR-associated endoribonuclease Cas2e [Bifidobacterium simiarum]MBT1165784.1 type I-E CRISPR-associated endoribonuclease Cas2 [Bifidobacterium simiarum]